MFNHNLRNLKKEHGVLTKWLVIQASIHHQVVRIIFEDNRNRHLTIRRPWGLGHLSGVSKVPDCPGELSL
jgi:hypothetical protein